VVAATPIDSIIAVIDFGCAKWVDINGGAWLQWRAHALAIWGEDEFVADNSRCWLVLLLMCCNVTLFGKVTNLWITPKLEKVAWWDGRLAKDFWR
jgi:hypothetical protein